MESLLLTLPAIRTQLTAATVPMETQQHQGPAPGGRLAAPQGVRPWGATLESGAP